MSKAIYLLRHCAIPENELGINGSRTDSSLSENGNRAAIELIPLLSSHNYDLIIVSPLKRTIQSIQPYLDSLINPPKVEIEPLTVERDLGVFTNTKAGGPIPEDIKKQGIGSVRWQPENGESTVQVGERAEKFLLKLRQRPETSILICGHQNFLRCLELLINQKPIDDEHYMSDNPPRLNNNEIRKIDLN